MTLSSDQPNRAAKPAARIDTKEAIFDAAERLFADHSFATVSLRDITSAASVNLAAVNYHFGSKDALIVELFKQRVTVLNRERARLLRQAEEQSGGVPPLGAIVHALLAPPLRWCLEPVHGLSISARFLHRAFVEGTPEVATMIETDVSHLQRFILPLARALPHLTHEEICWRLHFALGVMHYAISDLKRLKAISNGACDITDTEGVVRRAVDFACAGFRAVD